MDALRTLRRRRNTTTATLQHMLQPVLSTTEMTKSPDGTSGLKTRATNKQCAHLVLRNTGYERIGIRQLNKRVVKYTFSPTSLKPLNKNKIMRHYGSKRYTVKSLTQARRGILFSERMK
jgi:hypothetical protein